MIERPIVKDIREYEAAQIGAFTWRQIISIVIAAVIAIPTYYYGRYYLPKDLCGLLVFALAAIPIACGFVKVYGMPFEKFALIYFRNNLLLSPIRKYKTENVFREKSTNKNAKSKKKNKKKKIQKSQKHTLNTELVKEENNE